MVIIMKEKISGLIHTENIVSLIIIIYLFIIPITHSEYGVMLYMPFLVYIILSLSISLIWGFTGIFSFCQAIFLGVGGYVYCVLYKFFETPALTPLYGLIAIAASALTALVLGLFMFYGGINDVFVGLITLSLSLAVLKFMQTATGDQWKMKGKSGAFDLGGWTGMSQIPRLQIGSFVFNTQAYYLVLLIAVLAIYIALRILQKKKLGHSLIAIRENRGRSELFGYNVPKIQTIVFAIGGAIAGLSGVLYVGINKGITLDRVSVTASSMPIILVAAAGRKNMTGAVIFTVIYYLLDRTLSGTGGLYTPIITGAVLLLVIMLLPEGLFESIFKGIDSLFAKCFKFKTGKASN